MKRKLLGVLRVYETDADCASGLASKYKRADGTMRRNFELVLCPKSTFENGLEVTNQAQILAHELGHFVGHILNLPEHTRDREKIVALEKHGIQSDKRFLLPREKEAWNVADQILPGATSSEAYRVSMQGYTTHDTWLRNAAQEQPEPIRSLVLGE